MGGPVQQHGAVLVGDDGIPCGRDLIGIEVRVGHHGQYLPCGNLRHHDGPFVDAQLFVRCLLQRHVQGGIDAVPGILQACHIVGCLVAQGGAGIDQVVVGQGLYAGAAFRGVSHDVGEQICVRVHPGLPLVAVQRRLGQDIPVGGVDGAAVVPGKQDGLPGIVAVVEHLLFAGGGEIPQISDQYREQQAE